MEVAEIVRFWPELFGIGRNRSVFFLAANGWNELIGDEHPSKSLVGGVK